MTTDIHDRTTDRIAHGVPPTQRFGTRDTEILEDRERRVQALTAKVAAESRREALRSAGCQQVMTDPDYDPTSCERCSLGQLEHRELHTMVSRKVQERHIYTCPICGWWCWTRRRLW